MFDLEEYLNSSNFSNLCLAMDFLDEDIDEIRKKAAQITDDFEESIALIIYEQLLKYKETPSKEFFPAFRYHRWLSSNPMFSRDELFYQIYIRDNSRWEDIKNKMEMGVASGKINSDYLFEKEYYQELEALSKSRIDDALNAIYLHEINYLVKDYEDIMKRVFFMGVCNGYLENPLYFDEVNNAFNRMLGGNIPVNLKYLTRDDHFNPFIIVKNRNMATYIDSLIAECDDDYESGSCECILTYFSTMNQNTVLYVISCGDELNFKKRHDFSNIFIIEKELLSDSSAFVVNENSSLIDEFEGYVDDRIHKFHISLDEISCLEKDYFKLTTSFHNDDKTTWHILSTLDNEYDSDDFLEISSQNPLSEEFLGLISSLNLKIDDAYEIRSKAKTSEDVLSLISRKVGVSENDVESGILNTQIKALIDFKEVDEDYADDLAIFIKGKDIFDNGLVEYLNELIIPKVIEKPFLDDGKFAAPRWLVYPELDPYTIGWRMGYGEDYAMNEPWHTAEFNKLFPEPQNWSFDSRKSDLKRIPLLGYFWRDYGEAKYSHIDENPIKVNDFITFNQKDLEFRNNHFHFKSIEHAVLASKYSLFEKADPIYTSLNTLKRGFELTSDEIDYWNRWKYTVLLNACYYKFMQDDSLKERLLATGEKSLVYVSDDEWGGKDNLLGFALMELRDEIQRLYENENLIDWQYSEYLKHKDPYENPQKRNPNDMQSPEYMLVSSTLSQSKFFVRDCNLSDELADKYEIGQILTEKGFVGATDKIGGMATTHRYLILSNAMADFSQFEKDTDWGIHIAKANSKFKVLDICKINNKTQILLLQIPEGFENAFSLSNELIAQRIEYSRNLFEDCLTKKIIREVSGEDWLERISFPLGMDDDGNFF